MEAENATMALPIPETETFTSQLYSLNLLENKASSKKSPYCCIIDSTTGLPQPNYVIDVTSDAMVRAGTLLTTGSMSDVTFVVGSEKVQFPAHKFMLAMASEVFQAMFYGSIPEGKIVEVPDGNPEAFCLMLQYVYMGVVPMTINAELGADLLGLAHKYWLKTYEEHIARALAKSLAPWNAIIILKAAILYDFGTLEATCWDYIDVHIRAVIKSDSWCSLESELLCKLLQRDELQIRELELLYGVERWGLNKMNRRKNSDDLNRPPTLRQIHSFSNNDSCRIRKRTCAK